MNEIIKNIQKLRQALIGTKNCDIKISKECEKELNKMPYDAYMFFQNEFKMRNNKII